MDLEKDNIGQPVVMDRSILIPIGDTIYTGKLEITMKDMILFLKIGMIDQLPKEEQMVMNLQVIETIASKFTPDGIFDRLTDIENAAWIMDQWSAAFGELTKDKE